MSGAKEVHGPGATSLAVKAEGGNVLIVFPKPIIWCQLDPQTAFEAGEQIARAAHEARFGTPPQSDGSYIAQQVKARITEDLRDRMVARVALMLNSIGRKSHGEQAMMIVDTILAEVA